MGRLSKALVSRELIALAARQADDIMDKDPAIRDAWLNQCGTSLASRRDGGPLYFVTDFDWVPAFFVWYHGGGAALPREGAKERKNG